MKLLAVVGTLAIIGCSRTGAVEGDAYLRMQSGDVKPMAAMSVFYSPRDRVADLGKKMRDLCKSYAADTLRLHDSVAVYSRALTASEGGSLSAFDRALKAQDAWGDSMITRARRFDDSATNYKQAAVTASTRTDVHGHFTFDTLPPGPGVLWAETSVGDHPYRWARLIDVKRGDRGKADLDNSDATETDDCP